VRIVRGAEDELTYAVTAERSFVVDPTFAALEERYARAGFFRIHRATLMRPCRSRRRVDPAQRPSHARRHGAP
jgi:hypothetical protein